MVQRIGTPRQAQIALAVMRIVAGIIFMAHGYQKFFMMGIDGVTGFFTQVGVPLPGIMAIVIATLELAGGLALVLGFFARFVAVPLAFDILGAIITVHIKNGFFVPAGVEFVLLLLSAAVAIAIAGPGAFSIDAATTRSRDHR
jgi:putative oxidoreductase